MECVGEGGGAVVGWLGVFGSLCWITRGSCFFCFFRRFDIIVSFVYLEVNDLRILCSLGWGQHGTPNIVLVGGAGRVSVGVKLMAVTQRSMPHIVLVRGRSCRVLTGTSGQCKWHA